MISCRKEKKWQYFGFPCFRALFFHQFCLYSHISLLILIQDYDAPLKSSFFNDISVNTPLTTLISADKDLIDHVKSFLRVGSFCTDVLPCIADLFLSCESICCSLLKMVSCLTGDSILLGVMILAVVEAFCTAPYLLKSIPFKKVEFKRGNVGFHQKNTLFLVSSSYLVESPFLFHELPFACIYSLVASMIEELKDARKGGKYMKIFTLRNCRI